MQVVFGVGIQLKNLVIFSFTILFASITIHEIMLHCLSKKNNIIFPSIYVEKNRHSCKHPCVGICWTFSFSRSALIVIAYILLLQVRTRFLNHLALQTNNLQPTVSTSQKICLKIAQKWKLYRCACSNFLNKYHIKQNLRHKNVLIIKIPAVL